MPVPLKRTRRKRRADRNQVKRRSNRIWLESLVVSPALVALAEGIPLYEEGQTGRPPKFPPVVLLVFGICARKWKSNETAEAELRDEHNWEVVLEAFASDYPDYNLRPGNPVTYQEWNRFRAKFVSGDALTELFKDNFEQSAADQALAMGLLSPTGPGSITRMHRSRVVSGDGLVLQALYDTSPDDICIDVRTGEVWKQRADPDVRRYPRKPKDKRAKDDSTVGFGETITDECTPREAVIVGTKWVTTHVNTDHELERVTLTVDYEPQGTDGGEAAIAVAALKRIKARCPGMLGASWDKALRGKHINALYRAGILTIVKVYLVRGKAKKRRIDTYDVKRGSSVLGTIELWGVGGKPSMYRKLQGREEWIPLIKRQIKFRRSPRLGGSPALYQCAELPDDPRVPKHLRGGVVWFRHDNDGRDKDSTLSRAEVLRTVCEVDEEEWRDLYYDRPGSESDNERDQGGLAKRRAPSRGAANQQIDLICLAMAHNHDAELAYTDRTGRSHADVVRLRSRLA
jgi:hypothetical protein